MLAPAKFSRRVVDPVNSLAWFAMDGLWLAGLAWPAYVATGLTLATGGALVLFDRRGGSRLDDDLALNAWMWMNAAWVVSDLGGLPGLRRFALVIMAVGALLVLNAVRPDRAQPETPRHLKKLRTHHHRRPSG
jgi:hypothetical protein